MEAQQAGMAPARVFKFNKNHFTLIPPLEKCDVRSKGQRTGLANQLQDLQLNTKY
jgi:hypothetical protein